MRSRYLPTIRVPPRYLFKQCGLYWAEQYLLQAFLSMNPTFEVIWALQALSRDRPEAATDVGLGYGGETGGAWIRHLPERRQD